MNRRTWEKAQRHVTLNSSLFAWSSGIQASTTNKSEFVLVRPSAWRHKTQTTTNIHTLSLSSQKLAGHEARGTGHGAGQGSTAQGRRAGQGVVQGATGHRRVR